MDAGIELIPALIACGSPLFGSSMMLSKSFAEYVFLMFSGSGATTTMWHSPAARIDFNAWFRKSDLVPSVGTTIPICGAFTYSILNKFQV
jgi:hypothetical protein